MADIPGSPGDDTLTGSVPPGTVDRFLGSGGNDLLIGLNDFLDYSAFAAGNPIALTVTAPRFGTVVKVGLGTDTFEQMFFAYGTQGNDTATANFVPSGIETFQFDGRGGNDTLDGAGNRLFIASFFNAPAGINANLGTGSVSDGYGSTDTLTNVVNLLGSEQRDTILGAAAAETLQGGAGGDSIDGGAGNDVIGGGDGVDTLFGGLGRDTLRGGDGADVLDVGPGGGSEAGDQAFGDDGADELRGHATASPGGTLVFLTGGSGSDTIRGYGVFENLADYGDSATGVVATLGTAGSATRGGSEADVLDAVRRIRGSLGDDSIVGSAAEEAVLLGRGGADTAEGGAGRDRLEYLDFLQVGNATVGGGVNANLATGRATVAGAVQLVSGFEDLSGSDFDDTLTGDAGNNVFRPFAGTDSIVGGDGSTR